VEGWLNDKVAKTYIHVANSLFFWCPLLDSTSILRQEVATAHMQLAQKIVSETQRTGGLWQVTADRFDDFDVARALGVGNYPMISPGYC
jgi:hypothetical protein